MGKLVIVIRAGGTGTRLWPLSTAQVPKQFVPVLSQRTLLQETYARAAEFGAENIFVTANMRHVDLVREQLPELAPDHIFAEPLKRNTGPAIAYETAALRAYGLSDDTVVASLPADDFVGAPDAFRKSVRAIAEFLKHTADEIVMPVVTPTSIDPGYSYVRASFDGSDHVAIIDWIEKPDVHTCEQMVQSGEWFAHTGMYFWRLGVATAAFATYAPDVWSAVHGVYDSARAASVPIISIESLITKKYPRKIAWRANAWQWSDVGKWPVVKQLLASDTHHNTATHEQVRFVDAEHNLVYGSPAKRIVCVGVSHLVIVDSGNQLLVCHDSRAHEIGPMSERFGNV